VAPVPHWRFPSNLKGAFGTIARALLLGLSELGIQDGVAVAPRKGRPAQHLPSCFSTFNHREIAVGEKKLIGSAQRRTARAFLQHGSVLIDLDRELLNSLFIFNDPETRVRNLKILRESTTTLNEVCRRNLSFEEVSRAFRKGFERFFSGAVLSGELSPKEEIWQKEFLVTAKENG